VKAESEALAALALGLGVWVVLGSAHPLTPPHRPHNSVYVISDSGQVVDRYDKRFCSATEVHSYYTPGAEPTVFDVDGFRFGIAVCVEINFPHLFTEYGDLGVDCLLLPTYPVDAIFRVKAQALAATNNYWVAVASVAQTRHLVPSEVFSPAGESLAAATAGGEIVVADLDRTDPQLHVALNLALPWRAEAREGGIYRDKRVLDRRSSEKTSF
jgi:predicted amidohydrolase